jgi:LysM repeat protein
MTQADPGIDPSAPRTPRPRPPDEAAAQDGATRAVAVVRDACPYLLAADGSWRSAMPSRDHVCAAVGGAPLVLEKQRRLCLTEDHRRCPAYVIASGLDPSAPESAVPDRAITRPYPRTAPVALDHGRLVTAVPTIRADRTAAQYVLVGLMGLAFVAIALARLSADDGVIIAGVDPSPSPRVVAASATPTTRPTATPAVSAEPSGEPAASPSSSPVRTATPAPSVELRTYKVKSGDTLSGIAARFGTTVRKLRRLNDDVDPARLRIGTVLRIPPEQ